MPQSSDRSSGTKIRACAIGERDPHFIYVRIGDGDTAVGQLIMRSPGPLGS